MKKLLLLGLIYINFSMFPFLAQAQEAGFIWAKKIDGVGEPDIVRMVVDQSNNIYIAGYFEGQVDFDPSPSTHLITAIGLDDIFLAKYDANGNFLWVKRLGSPERDQPKDLIIDSSGNLYMCGYFYDTVDFDPSSGTANQTSNGNADGFIAKYNSSGEYQWAYKIGGTAYDDARALGTELNGGVYVAGSFQGTVDLDPGTGTNNKTSAGALDVYVIKFNASGTYQSGFSFGGTSSEVPTDLAMDCCGGAIFLSGEFYGSNADFDPGSGTHLMSSNGNSDLFLAKFGTTGHLYWAHSFGSSEYDRNAFIDVYHGPVGGEQIYLTGYFYNTIDLDPGAGTQNVTAADIYADIFLSKFDTDGNFLWGGRMGGTNLDMPTDLWVSGKLVFLTGEVRGTADMDISAGTYNITTDPISNPNAFIVWYNDDGDLQWANHVNDGLWSRAATVYYANDHVYLAGTFYATPDFDFGNGTFYLDTDTGPDEAFFAKYDYYMAAEPAQPTSLTFSGVNASGMQLSYNSSGAYGYLILKKEGSAPTSVPVDGTIYSVGNLVGDAEVAYVGSSTSPVLSGLSSATNHYYKIFGYNGSTAEYRNYNTGSPLQGNQTTLSVEPNIQSANISFTAFTTSTLSLNWTNGNGSEHLVLGRPVSAVNKNPDDGKGYTGNANFTAATDIGDNNRVLYRGSGNSVIVTGLSPGTEYHFRVFDLNGAGNQANYLTTTASNNPASRKTLASQPSDQATNLTFPLVTTNSIELNFDAAAGSPDGYLVLKKLGSAPTGVPQDGASYSPGNIINDAEVIQVSSSTNLTETGLLAGNVYHFAVYSYNGSDESTNYLTTVSGNIKSTITLPASPTAQSATNVSQTSFTANWLATTGAVGYKLDVSKDDFVTFVDGYKNKDIAGTSTSVAGLEHGVTYKYRVRAYNSSGNSANSNTITATTVPSDPSLNAISTITQTTAEVSWQAITGAEDYLLEVSTDNFNSLISGYDPKTVDGTNTIVTNLSPGTSHQVRLFSRNASGTSNSSTSLSFITIPADPVALDPIADDITASSFKAEWAAVTGTIEYELEVSSDDFTSLLAGYNPKIIDGATTQEIITDLNSKTVYKFRVRAVNSSGKSGYSNIISVETTEPLISLSLENVSYSSTQSSTGSQIINITVIGGSEPYEVKFKHRKLLETTLIEVLLAENSPGSYSKEITSTMIGELGLYFEVSVTDAGGQSDTESGNVFLSFNDTQSPEIPFERFGGTPETWNLFSVPYVLDNKSISSVFVDYDPSRHEYDWRIVRYRNSTNEYVNFNSGQINPGEAYWFNAKEEQQITIGAGAVVQELPFTKILDQGWNLIGNPYPVAISWEQVLIDNPTVTGVHSLQVFNGRNQETGDQILPFGGGFVWSDQNQSIKINPVTTKSGRLARHKPAISSNNIDASEWQLNLYLSTDEDAQRLGGFGMHPEALKLKDQYDEMAVPRFFSYTDLTLEHPEYFYPWFATDIVPPETQHNWTFTLNSNESKEHYTLQWDQFAIQHREADLFLLDKRTGMMIDMKKQASHELALSGNKALFEIIYSANGVLIIPDEMVLGTAYPNPANTQVTIPVVLPDRYASQVLEIAIYDINGRKISKVAEGTFDAGMYEFKWHINRDGINSGVYFYRLAFKNGSILPVQKKLLIQ